MGNDMSGQRGSESSNNNNNNSSKNDGVCWMLFCPHTTRRRRSSKRRKKDLLGTPLPTPVHIRRKVYADNIMSSRYQGLEKEVYLSTRGITSDCNSSDRSTVSDVLSTSGGLQVYEGNDAEMVMYQKYELMDTLGVGSTSTVHRCVDRSTGTSYACKVIDKEYIRERFQGMMDQFHTEIEALRSLSHPHIIQLYDVYVSEARIYIVMELMEGGELFDFVVQKGTLTEEEASTIVRKVTSALVYMHSNHIIHRDLKPENLLLKHTPKSTLDLEVKIIDFGLSKEVDDEMARSFLGTRGYLAPEMLQRLTYSKAIDVWALGVIVFVLLCGCLPFDDDSQPLHNPTLIQQKFSLRYPKWAKNLSGSAKDLLSRLLEINPRSRYTAEQALRHPWVRGDTADRNTLLDSPKRLTPRSFQRKKQQHKRDDSYGSTSDYPYKTPPRHTGAPTYQHLIPPPPTTAAVNTERSRPHNMPRTTSI